MAETDHKTGDDAEDGTGEPRPTGGGAVTLTVSGEEVTVTLSPDAGESEAAAIATAVGAHLHDRAVAAAAAASDDEGDDRADPWTLAGRMKAVGKRRWPDDVDRGDEWGAAARSFY